LVAIGSDYLGGGESMAYWQRRDGKVRVLGYDLQSKKKKVLLSRAESQHLDSMSDDEVEAWVRRWTNLQNLAAQVPKLTPVREPNILSHVERFLEYLAHNESKHPSTIAEYRRCIVNHALPFFTHARGCKALNDLPAHSKDLADWLKVSPKLLKRVNLSMAKFWRWATEEGLAEGNLVLRQLPIKADKTPLQFALAPSDLLAWQPERRDIELLGLLTYFFSLRPQEVVALEKADFAMGLNALSFEASRTMIKAGLDGGLVVNVVKQFSKGVGICRPKSMSAGVVACFNVQARQRLQRMIASADAGPLFSLTIDHYYHLWARYGIPGITLKDLRRASIYWLAHYTAFPLAALRNHARHSSIETTGLYTRRPEEFFA
jgi:hypothetical protein